MDRIRRGIVRKELTGSETPVRDKAREILIGRDMEHVETRIKTKSPFVEEERVYRKKPEPQPNEEKIF